jgi:hypothetical protein
MQHGKIDVIGDVHGMLGRLLAILSRLGYVQTAGRWRNRDARRIVFVGDYIDRGPRSRDVMQVVQQLREDGIAVALLGNHDTNAIAYCLNRRDRRLDGRGAWRSHQDGGSAPAGDERWVRPHDDKNRRQHDATIASFCDPSQYHDAIHAILDLPVWIQLPDIRVIHAAWIPSAIKRLDAWTARAGIDSLGIAATSMDEAIDIQRTRRAPSEADWVDLLDIPQHVCASRLSPDHSAPVALERLLKGVEIQLPHGIAFCDASNHPRRDVRVRWFDAAGGRTYHEHALMRPNDVAMLKTSLPTQRIENLRADPGTPSVSALIPFHDADAYGHDERLVLFGHYALFDHGRPDFGRVLRANVGCVDNGGAFSQAEGGRLTAYRWSGEKHLNELNFVDADRDIDRCEQT